MEMPSSLEALRAFEKGKIKQKNNSGSAYDFAESRKYSIISKVCVPPSPITSLTWTWNLSLWWCL